MLCNCISPAVVKILIYKTQFVSGIQISNEFLGSVMTKFELSNFYAFAETASVPPLPIHMN